MVKPFKVELTVERIHTFLVDANTPEEAESVAEQFLEDGEDGAVETITIVDSFALPVEEGAEGDIYEAEEESSYEAKG